MKITKALTISAIAYSTVLSASANEYKNENVQLQDVINNLNCEQNLILADELFCWNGSKFQLVNFKKNSLINVLNRKGSYSMIS